MHEQFLPIISNVTVWPAAGLGGTLFSAAGGRYEVVIDIDQFSSGRLTAQFVEGPTLSGNFISAAETHREEMAALRGNSELRLTSISGSSAVVSQVSLRKGS